ncbi:hypothetical protein STEG23_034846, partial [Scotinomys teguina]
MLNSELAGPMLKEHQRLGSGALWWPHLPCSAYQFRACHLQLLPRTYFLYKHRFLSFKDKELGPTWQNHPGKMAQVPVTFSHCGYNSVDQLTGVEVWSRKPEPQALITQKGTVFMNLRKAYCGISDSQDMKDRNRTTASAASSRTHEIAPEASASP